MYWKETWITVSTFLADLLTPPTNVALNMLTVLRPSPSVCRLYGSSCDSWSTSPSSATSRHTSLIFCSPAGLLTHIPWNCSAFGHTVGLSRSENSLEVRRARLQRRSCKVVEQLATVRPHSRQHRHLQAEAENFYSAHFMINHSQLLLCNVSYTVGL